MLHTHVIYQPGDTSIQTTVYHAKDEVLRASYTSERPFREDPFLYPDRPADAYLEELNKKRKPGSPEFQIMAWEEASPLIEEAEDKVFPTPWSEISEETWNRMLNILPPCRWRTVRGVEMFFISEPYASNFHEHYARLEDRYFSRRCRITTPYEDLAEEVHKFAFLADRKFPEGMEQPTKCALCPTVLPFSETYSPEDEAICPKCDTEVTGRIHEESI